MTRRKNAQIWGVATVLAFAVMTSPVAGQERVGVAAAVNPAATGQPPGGAVRTLLVGTDVVFNEKIVTSADGQTQILFLDRSAFSVGPNSEIVIDEFVYDPKSGSGKLAASVTKGVFRFVGGALSKNENAVSIKAPSATIGIRGGMVGFNVAPGGPTIVMKMFGNAVTLTTPIGTQTILRNDFFQSIDPQGRFASSSPSLATREVRQSTSGGLLPIVGSTGGATQPPTQTLLASSGFTQINASNVYVAQGDANARTPQTPPPVIDVGTITNSPDLKPTPSRFETGGLTGNDIFDLLTFLIDSGTDLTSVTLPSGVNVTDVTQIPATGTAFFSGNVIGAFFDSAGTRRIDSSGSFTMNWLFSTNNGIFSLSFAGDSFSGTISSPGPARNVFTGVLPNGRSTGPDGLVTGQFATRISPADTVFGTFQGGGPAGNGFALFRGP